MQLHELKRRTKNKKTHLIGRGGTRGKTSGRGGKGQTARAGHKARPEMRDIIKKLPKLRGYAFKSFQEKTKVVNLGQLENAFKSDTAVNPKALVEAGVIKKFGNQFPRVKILSMGDVTKKFTVSDVEISLEAKAKIEKAGGSVK